MKNANRTLLITVLLGWAAAAVLPWYGIEYGFWNFEWLTEGYPFDIDYAPLLLEIVQGFRLWLVPIALFLLVPLPAVLMRREDPRFGWLLIFGGFGGLAYLLAQGFAIGINGWSWAFMDQLFGSLGDRQFGMGYGALIIGAAFLLIGSQGLAARGAVKGDSFIVSSIATVVALVALFIFYPVLRILSSAVETEDGGFSLIAFGERFVDRKIWGLGCIGSNISCGVAWNSLFLGVVVGLLTTILGLAFALFITRSGSRFANVIRALSVLPIITPPFVIGLAIILLFGLSGQVTTFVADLFGVAPTRWIYGLPGVALAQVMSFTPIAFLVLIGVVEGVSPSMEEAALTMRASPWQMFKTVTLPLMRPGLANAFLLGFIESMADFGNPLVLGGNFQVLSTEIFFSIVGAQHDQSRAAVLAIILLTFTLLAFFAQQRWLGRKSYVSVSGKGDAGVHPKIPNGLGIPVRIVVMTWVTFTLIVYGMIVYGSFVELWGVNSTLTLRHYISAFSINFNEFGIHWSGSAWGSFWTTITISAIAAPLTAMLGLVTAYLLVRQKFAGQGAFEFGTMLSFAIPGTVIGISYILAFNVPPIELTGTGVILVISFIFRNMPVGVRAGVASLAQLDKSLDEASLTLHANNWQTFRHVVLPLLRPAILAALVYSFVRAMTAISAVIFLVSAQYNMATSYIIGRVENNEYGIAIAYSTALIFVMLIAIGVLQLLVGRRNIGRRTQFSEAQLIQG